MESSTTPPADTPLMDIIITESPPLMVPLETQMFTSSFGTSSPTIDTILDNYFGIFPSSYLLVLVAIGIMSILIYTLYSYLED